MHKWYKLINGVGGTDSSDGVAFTQTVGASASIIVPCTTKSRMIKDVRWSGWVWVGGRSFWYRPTWVVTDKGPLNSCVCVTWLELQSELTISMKVINYNNNL